MTDRANWASLASQYLDYNYRQSWGFGLACARRIDATSEHIVVRSGLDVIGLADVRIKNVPMLNTGIAYINGGPLVRRGGHQDPDRLLTTLIALHERYVNERGLMLRVAPCLGPEEWNAAQSELFATAGYYPSSRAASYRTLVMDIERPLGEIRSSFAQKWRNCLNCAEKSGIQIKRGSDEELFDRFCTLYDELVQRKCFDTDLDAAFYARVHHALEQGSRFHLSLAEFKGQAIAGHVASMLGDTCVYILGASNETGRKCKASYLLQWDTIVRARERGCLSYDLGGIDPERNVGVYRFKRGMSGIDTTAPGPFEAWKGSLRRFLLKSGETLYRWRQRKRYSANMQHWTANGSDAGRATRIAR